MKKRNLFVLTVVGLALAGGRYIHCQEAGPSAPAVPQIIFDKYEILTGPAERRTVLTGFLLDGPMAEIAVVNVDPGGERRLRIYALGDSIWVPKLEATLRPEVLFVDVANIGGRDRLITYEPGRLNGFDPESAMEAELLVVNSNFSPPRKGEIPHVDITRDLNGDGRDDLVVPDVDGFRVFVQKSDGRFAEPLQVGPATDMSRIYGADGYRYDPWRQSRIYEIDYNHDHRIDLVFWNGERFEVHAQDEQGLFAAEARTFATAVPFDSDNLNSLTTADMTGRVLYTLADLNGDGYGDLVIFSLAGPDISGKRSGYEVHFGAPAADGGTVFAAEAGAVFKSEGRIQLGMDPRDFDGDGQLDLMLTTIETRYLESSLWKRIKGAMGDDIWLDIEFYRMEGGRYLEKPTATRRRQLDGAPSHREPGWVPLELVLRGGAHEIRNTYNPYPRAFNTTLLIGDVNGDGRLDLLIEETFRNLNVFTGVPGPDLFDRQTEKVQVDMPGDEEYTWLADLNNDGKQDILLHHASASKAFSPHQAYMTAPQITILIAR